MQTGQFTVKIINSDTKPTETARGARVVHILHRPSVQNHVPRSSNLVRKIRNAHMSQNRAKKSRHSRASHLHSLPYIIIARQEIYSHLYGIENDRRSIDLISGMSVDSDTRKTILASCVFCTRSAHVACKPYAEQNTQ